MDKKQEYYNSSYGYVTLFADVKDNPDLVVISGGDDGEGVLQIARRDSLVKKEESYRFTQETKRADQLKAITVEAEKNLDAIADKIVDKALKGLGTRMKMNVVFKKGISTGEAGWALTIVDELEKMIKEETKEKLKGEKGIFD